MAFEHIESKNQKIVYDKRGKEVLVFGHETPIKITGWVIVSGDFHGGQGSLEARSYSFKHIPIEEIKTLGLWDKLEGDFQEELIALEAEEGDLTPKTSKTSKTSKTHNRRNGKNENNAIKEAIKIKKIKAAEEKAERIANGEVAHQGRQADPRYEGLPRKIKCTGEGCSKESGIGPGLLLEKAKEAGQTWEEYVAAYKCRSCKGGSGRGRSVDPKYDGVPREFPCSVCGKEIKMGPGMLLNKAEEAGVTHQEFIKSYKCQKCGGAKGRGRTADPKYKDVPRELVCTCGKKSGIGPGKLLTDVESSGKTLEQYMAAYRCRKCKKESNG